MLLFTREDDQTRHKIIINLVQQLVLGTTREHFALTLSLLALHNNPSRIKSHLEFAVVAQADCQSNIGTSHLNIFNLRRKNNLS